MHRIIPEVDFQAREAVAGLGTRLRSGHSFEFGAIQSLVEELEFGCHERVEELEGKDQRTSLCIEIFRFYLVDCQKMLFGFFVHADLLFFEQKCLIWVEYSQMFEMRVFN